MKVRDIMTANPATCTPESTAQEVARLLEQHDCGALPVVEAESRRLVGMITDRDLAIRGLAHGKGGDAKVRDLMSPSPATVQADDDVKKVEELMPAQQTRRVPGVAAGARPVGLVPQAALARERRGLGNKEVGRVLEHIPEPAEPVHR